MQIDASAPVNTFADEFVRIARRRSAKISGWTVVAAIILGAAFGFASIAPFVLIVAIGIPVLFWRYPRACLYAVLGSVCLFEAFSLSQPDSLTDRVPMFWNVNTIVQVYGHVDFHGVPLNLLEVLLVTAGCFSLVQAVYMRRVGLRVGPVAGPIFVYTAFVLLAWMNGLATGGEFNFSLLEIRPPLYFLFAYLMTANLAQDQTYHRRLIRMAVACIGIKAILYTYRLYVTMNGTVPDQGVGSHEEVFFFNAFFVLLLLLGLTGAEPRLRAAMWVILPVVVTGHLACNRRAGVAALIIALPVLLIIGFAALPRRRKLIGVVGAILAVAVSIYYPFYRNKSGMWAQPAQAIKSVFEPDARDASSDAYRKGEDQNLMATIKSAPIQGIGYGKRMLVVADLSYAAHLWEFWDKLPHNTLLWIWMRTGSLGFFAFWLMFVTILMYGCQIVREAEGPEAQTLAMFSVSVLVMWVIAGLFDMGFTQVRIVLFSGFAVGLLTCIPRRDLTVEHPTPGSTSQAVVLAGGPLR
ncbi:MAG: O-antigen ligase family protein [Actinomycetota bacterium]